MDTLTLNKEQIERLVDVYRKLNHLEANTQNIIHPLIAGDIVESVDTLGTILEPYFTAEEEEADNEMSNLRKIAESHGFSTVWSMDIKSTELHKLMPHKVKSIIYGTHNVHVDKVITWLEFWKIADKIINKNKNSDHIFIEEAVYSKSGTVHLRTGS